MNYGISRRSRNAFTRTSLSMLVALCICTLSVGVLLAAPPPAQAAPYCGHGTTYWWSTSGNHIKEVFNYSWTNQYGTHMHNYKVYQWEIRSRPGYYYLYTSDHYCA